MTQSLRLARVVDSFGCPQAFTRPGASSYTNGRHTEAAASSFTITAVIQPAAGREIETLPEGRTVGGVLMVHAKRDLSTVDPKNLRNADRFTYDGRSWEIIRTENWFPTSGFYKAYAALVDCD